MFVTVEEESSVFEMELVSCWWPLGIAFVWPARVEGSLTWAGEEKLGWYRYPSYRSSIVLCNTKC
jgi:hypothetical protein